ncbi:MAG: hypothetical protein ACFFBD_06540, partial [Candidatus Hodarchaeota archaeon]
MTQPDPLTLDFERKDIFYGVLCALMSFLLSIVGINLEGEVTNWITALFLSLSLSLLLIPVLGLGRPKFFILIKHFLKNQTTTVKLIFPLGFCIISYFLYLIAAGTVNLIGILLLGVIIIVPTLLLYLWPHSFQPKKPWIELLILALWWITFDHRYLKDIWFIGFYYQFNAIILVNLIIFCFVIERDIPDTGYSLLPNAQDLKEGILWLVP